MEHKKSEILEAISTTLNELMQISKSFSINFTSFENKYFNMKKQLTLYIEKEENESLKNVIKLNIEILWLLNQKQKE